MYLFHHSSVHKSIHKWKFSHTLLLKILFQMIQVRKYLFMDQNDFSVTVSLLCNSKPTCHLPEPIILSRLVKKSLQSVTKTPPPNYPLNCRLVSVWCPTIGSCARVARPLPPPPQTMINSCFCLRLLIESLERAQKLWNSGRIVWKTQNPPSPPPHYSPLILSNCCLASVQKRERGKKAFVVCPQEK